MFVCIDVGGTNTRIAVSEDGTTFRARDKFATEQDYELAQQKMFSVIAELVGEDTIAGIAIGVPGVVSRDRTELLRAPHLQQWIGVPLAQQFAAQYDCPVMLQNDAAFGALGEAVYGAGKGKQIVAFLALGTGVGGARVVDRAIDAAAQGFEPGHHLISPKPPAWDETSQGSFEAYVSGTSFGKRTGVTPGDCLTCTDPVAWEELGRHLGQGIVNISLLWSPDLIVIGGGFGVTIFDRVIDGARAFVNAELRVMTSPDIVAAALGDDANLYGGLHVVSNQ